MLVLHNLRKHTEDAWIPRVLCLAKSGTIRKAFVFHLPHTAQPKTTKRPNWRHRFRPETKVLADDWTAVTRDKSLSAQFEHSVGVTADGAEIFTLSPMDKFHPTY